MNILIYTHSWFPFISGVTFRYKQIIDILVLKHHFQLGCLIVADNEVNTEQTEEEKLAEEIQDKEEHEETLACNKLVEIYNKKQAEAVKPKKVFRKIVKS